MVKYLGERVVELAELEGGLGKWDLRGEQRGNCARLRRSIKAKGIIEPLLVQQEENGRLVLLDGHRRYHIAKELGLQWVKVLVVEGSEDELKELVAVRHTIDPYGPLEKARMAKLYSNSGMRLEEIAALLGCTKGYISDLVNIWSLGNGVVRALEEGKLSIAHARLLLRLEAARREEVLQAIIKRRLSVRQTKTLIERGRAVLTLKELSELLPPGASLREENGWASFILTFSSVDELKGQLWAILQLIQGVEGLELRPEPKEERATALRGEVVGAHPF